MRLLTAAALLALAAACTPMTTAETGMGATTDAGAINMARSQRAEFTMMGPFPVVDGGFRP